MSRFVQCEKCQGSGDKINTWPIIICTVGLVCLFPMECRHCKGLGGVWR